MQILMKKKSKFERKIDKLAMVNKLPFVVGGMLGCVLHGVAMSETVCLWGKCCLGYFAPRGCSLGVLFGTTSLRKK